MLRLKLIHVSKSEPGHEKFKILEGFQVFRMSQNTWIPKKNPDNYYQKF